MNALQLLETLWQRLVLQPLFVFVTTLLGGLATPLSDWLIRSTARRMAPDIARECERQWIADFYDLPPWLRLQSASSLFFSRKILEGRRKTRLDSTFDDSSAPVVLADIRRNEILATSASNYDNLTGMLNRRGFQRHLARYSLRSLRVGEGLAIIVVGLDKFTSINLELGPLGGDAVLKEMGRRLRRTLRRRDYLGRVGGDEFAIVLPNTSRMQARRMAECVRQACELSLVVSETTILALSGSVGLASKTKGLGAEDAFQRATAALQLAKSGGRNCVVAN